MKTSFNDKTCSGDMTEDAVIQFFKTYWPSPEAMKKDIHERFKSSADSFNEVPDIADNLTTDFLDWADKEKIKLYFDFFDISDRMEKHLKARDLVPSEFKCSDDCSNLHCLRDIHGVPFDIAEREKAYRTKKA
jgi:hypothetical protein